MEIISCTPRTSDCADRILAICKEMLVPEEDNQGFGTATVSPYKTWNSCRSELLKQLGEKA